MTLSDLRSPAQCVTVTAMTRIQKFTTTTDFISLFTESDCWALALTLHDRTGMPIVLASDGSDAEEKDMGWTHVGILLPDGSVLDIEGIHDPDAWMDTWGAYFFPEEVEESDPCMTIISRQGLQESVQSNGIEQNSDDEDIDMAIELIFSEISHASDLTPA